MNKRTVNLNIEVTAPKDMTNKQIEKLVNDMLNCGYNDATETLESGEGNLEDAEDVTNLIISSPRVVKG